MGGIHCDLKYECYVWYCLILKECNIVSITNKGLSLSRSNCKNNQLITYYLPMYYLLRIQQYPVNITYNYTQIHKVIWLHNALLNSRVSHTQNGSTYSYEQHSVRSTAQSNQTKFVGRPISFIICTLIFQDWLKTTFPSSTF